MIHEIAVLMFDGLMIYGDYYHDTKLLTDITDYVEIKLPGLGMKWKKDTLSCQMLKA